MKTAAQSHQEHCNAVRARLQKMLDAGLCTKAEIGRYVLGGNGTRNLASATAGNWLAGRNPEPERLAQLEAFLRSKERTMRAILAKASAPVAG